MSFSPEFASCVSKNSLMGVGSTPGKGMFAPTRAIKRRAKVKKIFCRSSGILRELVKAESISMKSQERLFRCESSAGSFNLFAGRFGYKSNLNLIRFVNLTSSKNFNCLRIWTDQPSILKRFQIDLLSR